MKVNQSFIKHLFLAQCYDLDVRCGGRKPKPNTQKTKQTNKKLKDRNTLRLMYTPLYGQEMNKEIREEIYICFSTYANK